MKTTRRNLFRALVAAPIAAAIPVRVANPELTVRQLQEFLNGIVNSWEEIDRSDYIQMAGHKVAFSK